MSVSVATFLDRLARSELLGEGDLRALRDEAGPGDGDAEPLVKRLVKEGRLTPYQAKALWRDKGHKLALGNYVIEDELGRGGMGVVLKARHRRMKRHVAIKVLPSAVVKDSEAIARFQREVEAAAQLNHPNIVGAHDADEIGGLHFLVMEFVDGRDLDSVVRKHGVLGVDQAIDCILQAARGLQYAHERGIVHRDIKPANLLLDANGTVKILDMGLARFVDSAAVGTQAELTGTGTVMGTVDYMSPEQALSTKSADARSDVYSLGMSLFRLLANRPAFEGDSLMARLLAHRTEPIPRIADHNRDVPHSVQLVFERMVAKEAKDRYQTMNEVIAALEACRGERSATPPATVAASATDEEAGLGDFLSSFSSPKAPTDRGNRTAGHGETRDDTDGDSTRTQAVTSDTLRRPPRRRKKTAAPPPKLVPAWIRDWRLLTGVGGALVLLVAVLAFAFSGGDTDDDSNPIANANSSDEDRAERRRPRQPAREARGTPPARPVPGVSAAAAPKPSRPAEVPMPAAVAAAPAPPVVEPNPRIHLRFLESVHLPSLKKAVGITISDDGRFAYAAAWEPAAITLFERDPESGRLRFVEAYTDRERLAGVTELQLGPDGTLAAAPSFTAGTVTSFTRDPASGRLSFADHVRNGTRGATGLDWAMSVAFSPDGRFVYAASERGAALVTLRIEPDGRLEFVDANYGRDGSVAGARSLCVSPDGTRIHVAAARAGAITVFDCDPGSGRASVRQVLREGQPGLAELAGVFSVTASADGRHVYTSSGRFGGRTAICTFVGTADGSIQRVQTLADWTDFAGGNTLALTPDGRQMLVCGTTSNSLVLLDRDPDSGSLQLVQTLPNSSGPLGGVSGVAFSPDGRYAYAAAETDGAISVFVREVLAAE